MTYKINIHAHTIYSDGHHEPMTMAKKAKELGFSALVITDHYYGDKYYGFMNPAKMKALRKDCKKASTILPIIVGLEVLFMDEEVLVFGKAAIDEILKEDALSVDKLLQLKQDTNCAVILCHPGNNFKKIVTTLDGFEHVNNGNSYFRSRPFGVLKGLPRWCNSDAHSVNMLELCYNIVDSKIETEEHLISYIKSGKQPGFYIMGKE